MYRGTQAIIPCGAGGFDGSDNVFRVSITDLIRARNIVVEGDAWRKSPGATAFDANRVAATTTSSASTTFTATGVTDGAAWNLSAVLPGSLAVASGGSTGLITSVTDASDTIGVVSWSPSQPVNGETVAIYPALRDASEWIPNVSTQRIVSFWSDGKVYKEVSGDTDSITLVSGLNGIGPSQLVAGGGESALANRKLFLFSEFNPVKVLSADGAVMNTISAPPPDWTGTSQPFGGGILGRRLFGYGNSSFQHAIYFSGLTNHEDFTTGSPPIAIVYSGEGQYIASAIPFLKIAEETRLYCFKYPFGLYYVDISDPTDVDVYRVRDDVGMSGPNGWCRANNDIFFVSSTGSIHSMRASQGSEDIETSDVTAEFRLMSFIRDNVNLSRLKYARLTYDEVRKELHYSFTPRTGPINGAELILNLSRGTVRVTTDDRAFIYESTFKYRESDGKLRLYGGGTGGKILKFNQASRNVDGSAFTGEFVVPDTDLSFVDPKHASEEKRFDYLEAIVTPTGNYSISFDVYIDGQFSETVQMNLGSSGAVYGTGIFGTDRYGGRSVASHKVRLHGRGRRIGLRGYNSGLNQDFSISQLILHYKIDGVRKGVH